MAWGARGLGFRARGLGFRARGLGFRAGGLGFGKTLIVLCSFWYLSGSSAVRLDPPPFPHPICTGRAKGEGPKPF